MCAFLSQANQSEFVCIDIHEDTSSSAGLSLSYRKNIPAPQLDLADFAIAESRIWALWTNAEGEFSISNYPLVRGLGMSWSSVAMESPPDRYCIENNHSMDPREAYCNYIFQLGIFEREVIAKALYVRIIVESKELCFFKLYFLVDVSTYESPFRNKALHAAST